MTKFNIILFLCNWGPHAAFQTLQDQCADIPHEIKMIRIPCTGRITKSLLLKAFEMGADGAALVGCSPGACRYGRGTETAERNIEDTRNILEIIGLGKNRLRNATFLPDEPSGLLAFLTKFTADIRALGKTPVTPDKNDGAYLLNDDALPGIISRHDVYACQDCGKCSSACPLTLIGKPFSPRAIANAVIAGDMDSSRIKEDIWACLTCGLCYDRCPSSVNFPEFIRDIRRYMTIRNQPALETHGGFFHSLMRTMASPAIQPRKWQWLDADIRLNPESRRLFFGGCAPYFDAFFKNHLGVSTTDTLRDSLRLMNFFDIHPSVLENERCCGHDLLWSGDEAHFRKLAALNVEAIHHRKIEEIITACPECYRTLAHDYPRFGFDPGCKITHLYDLLEKEIDKGGIDFKNFRGRMIYQDACRLSRFEDASDLPRKILHRLKPESFQEFQENGRAAICCGNSAWIGCDSFNKALQVKRLKQARSGGADLLVTSCPKCQIHLRCAMEDPFLGDEISMETKDLISVMAETITWA